MSNCNICGGMAGVVLRHGYETTAWMNYVRALYTEELDYLEPKLSGVGFIQSNMLPIVLPAQEGSSSLHHSQKGKTIELYPTDGNLKPSSAVSGFIFHRICWQLLEWACYPEELNFRLLYRLLRSFGAVPGTQLVNWGHTYAGSFVSNDSSNRSIFFCPDPSQPLWSNVWANDPDVLGDESIRRKLCGFGLQPLLKKEHSRQQASSALTTRPEQDSSHTKVFECFENLPTEILQYILTLLPSADVLAVKRASRSFKCIPLGNAFWLSRFDTGQQFESIIEPWLYKQHAIREVRYANPKVVYQILRSESSSGTVRNRQRIWSLLKPLVALILSFQLYKRRTNVLDPCGDPLASIWNPNMPDEDTGRWECAHGELLNSEIQPFHFGCRPLFKRALSLTKDLIYVKVSCVSFHDNITYITGLRFCFSDRSETELGYVLEDQEVTLSLLGCFRGFNVATSERGVHAISVINGDGKVTSTVGVWSPHKARKIGRGDRVTKIKAYFDGFKMVYLAVPDFLYNASGPYCLWKESQDYLDILRLPGTST